MQQNFNYDVISGVTSNGVPKNILVNSDGSLVTSNGGLGGSVSVSNFPATFPATQSGTWTISRSERTYTRFRVDTSTSGDNTIIVAPGAGVSLYIAELVVINKSANNTLVLLKEGSTTIGDVDMPSEGDGIVLSYGYDSEWKLPANTALVGNLSGNNNIAFWGRFRTA